MKSQLKSLIVMIILGICVIGLYKYNGKRNEIKMQS